MAAQPQDAASRIESEVRRIRGLIDRHAHAEALSVAGALLEQAPAYLELIAHWEQVLPGKILRVPHEELVDDVAGNVARMLEFLDLPFEPGCLEFYKTERTVRTASSEQVRQPIFRDGIDQWRNFDPWLGELRSALER
jgi:hypothetical protein